MNLIVQGFLSPLVVTQGYEASTFVPAVAPIKDGTIFFEFTKNATLYFTFTHHADVDFDFTKDDTLYFGDG